MRTNCRLSRQQCAELKSSLVFAYATSEELFRYVLRVLDAFSEESELRGLDTMCWRVQGRRCCDDWS